MSRWNRSVFEKKAILFFTEEFNETSILFSFLILFLRLLQTHSSRVLDRCYSRVIPCGINIVNRMQIHGHSSELILKLMFKGSLLILLFRITWRIPSYIELLRSICRFCFRQELNIPNQKLWFFVARIFPFAGCLFAYLEPSFRLKRAS